MKNKLSLLPAFCALVLLAAGCSTTYKPGAPVPKLSGIPDTIRASQVAFASAQPSKEKIEVSQKGTGYTVYGSLGDWTDSAVRALNRTLQKKGSSATASSASPIKISVTQVTLSTAASGWSFRCTVVFTVDLGDGNPLTLGADDTSWKWPNACDAAIEKLVLVTLHDERVLKALGAK